MENTIHINGGSHPHTAARPLPEVLSELRLEPSTVLVEINGDAPPRSEWPGILIQPGDRLEILRVSAGG